MMNGELKKMVIQAYTESDYDASDTPKKEFAVMFNPTSYSQKYEVAYYARQGQGDKGSPQVFKNVPPQEYSFEFVFDGTGTAAEKVDVKTKVEEFLDVAYNYKGEIHRPMYLKLSWGKFISRCVLKSAEVTYNLFEADGSPLRAKVNATFVENVEDTLRAAEQRDSSPDLTHRRVVKEGDHLTLLSQEIYGDPSYYLQIAAVNGLNNYRSLEVGQELVFPPVKEIQS